MIRKYGTDSSIFFRHRNPLICTANDLLTYNFRKLEVIPIQKKNEKKIVRSTKNQQTVIHQAQKIADFKTEKSIKMLENNETKNLIEPAKEIQCTQRTNKKTSRVESSAMNGNKPNTRKKNNKKCYERNKNKYLPNAGLECKIYHFTGFEFVTCFVKWNKFDVD